MSETELREALLAERDRIRCAADDWLHPTGYMPAGWRAGRDAAIRYFVGPRLDDLLAAIPAEPEQADEGLPDVEALRTAYLGNPADEGLDVERLARAMLILDDADPGVFNIIAISDPYTRDVAESLADEYARLARARDAS